MDVAQARSSRRHPAVRALQAGLGLLSHVALLWLSTCGPTPPGFQASAGAAPCGAADCGSGSERVCKTHCRTVVGAGAPCNSDLCAATGNLCQANLACVSGTCQAQLQQLAPCDPTKGAVPGNICPDGTYCRAASCPNSGLAPAGAKGICAAWVPEGGLCGLDWAQVVNGPAKATNCAPCEPGTECVLRSPSDKNPTCLRTCSPSPDGKTACPCDGYQCVAIGSNTPLRYYCEKCSAIGAACGKPTDVACDPTAVCAGGVWKDGASTSCDNAQCSPQAMCCNGHCTVGCGTSCLPCPTSAPICLGGVCRQDCAQKSASDATWEACNPNIGSDSFCCDPYSYCIRTADPFCVHKCNDNTDCGGGGAGQCCSAATRHCDECALGQCGDADGFCP